MLQVSGWRTRGGKISSPISWITGSRSTQPPKNQREKDKGKVLIQSSLASLRVYHTSGKTPENKPRLRKLFQVYILIGSLNRDVRTSREMAIFLGIPIEPLFPHWEVLSQTSRKPSVALPEAFQNEEATSAMCQGLDKLGWRLSLPR